MATSNRERSSVNGVNVVASRVDGIDDKALREMADRLRDKLQPAVVVLGTVQGDKVALLAAVSKDAQKVIMLAILSSKLLRSWVVGVADGQTSPRPAEKTARAWMKRCKRCMS